MSNHLIWENPENEEVLKTLARAIALSQGDFSLCLVRCNYLQQREKMVARLQELCALPLRKLILDKSIKTLFSTIQQELGEEQPNALIVLGLEAVDDLDGVLNSANQVREEFSKSFAFPLLLWITDEVQRKFIRIVPDIESWATTHRLGFSSEEVIQLIAENVQRVVERLVEVGAGIFVENAALDLAVGSPRRLELEAARQEVQTARIELAPELQVGLEFILTRDIDYYGEKSRQCYERGLELLQKTANSQRSESVNAELLAGCLLYHLGLWWRRYGVEHRAEYDEACDRAQSYFQQCVDLFVNAQQPDLAARFINALGDVLQRQQKWTELAKVAETALAWHQTYPHPFRLARAYGFLAEVAISESYWDRGWELATTAGELLESAAKQVAPEEKLTVDWERSTHGSWYLLSQARSLAGKGEYQSAIAKLETAIQQSKPQYDPMLYILILEEMRSLYFQSKEFLAAFQTKQLQRSIEQQFGFRAFIGAGRVQAKQHVSNLALTPGSMASEIAASGREQDVKRLIARIERADHRLTIIHGQSGVGKSSILQAGLIPALRQITLDARQLVPVLQQVYPDWVQELGKSLMAMVEEVKPGAWLGNEGKAIAPILEQLRKNNPAYLLTVLIFDQFEEFFFIYKEPQQRRHFYEFLKQCMDIPHVKVILSLREDYLHYLLECNNRLIDLGVINNNILDKGILYYLGNFSPEDAKQVIQNLTRQSQFNLEPSLLDELVRDLAGELGEVRPIELQVVGAQLQTEKIVTLKQYQERGPKNAIVGRFLDEVVQDCGTDNEQIAKLILYLLTDENNTRPLKTRADLEMELEVQSERLDLVLEILVTSRLVFRIPAFPEDRYQLVHDYLVSFVRQQQSSQLIAELEKEREQRKLTEARLTQVLKRELQTARKATFTLGGLVIAIGGFALVATVTAINIYLNSLALASAQKNGLEQLLSAIEAGKQLKKLSIGAIPEIKTIVAASLNNAINQTKEINNLKMAEDITGINFSKDGQLMAILCGNKPVRIWRINDNSVNVLPDHLDVVNSANFSDDSKMIVTASKDKTVKIWNINGTLLKTLKGIHSASITTANFSHNGKLIVTASEDKTVKVWKIDGTLIKTFKEHSDSITSVNFSHDDKMIVSADTNDQIKIWSINSENVQTIDHYGTATVKFSPNSQKIIAINKDMSQFYYDLNGNLIKNILNPTKLRFDRSSHNSDSLGVSAISNDNKTLVHANQDDIILEVIDGLMIIERSHKDKISHLIFSPDGKIIASASKDKSVKLWSINTNVYNHEFTRIVSIAPEFKGETIAFFSDNSEIKLSQINGNKIPPIKVDGSAIDFSFDGRNFVTENTQNGVKVFNIERSEIKLETGNSNFTNISFSPNGKIIATINNDNIVNLWHSNGNFIASLRGDTDRIKSVNFSPDSQRIVTVEHNSAKIWRNDGQIINTLAGHSEEINSVIFSPDSQIISSIGDDNIVNIFNNDGKLIKQLIGHQSQVNQLVFSPNSQIIASISSSGFTGRSEIKLWQGNGNFKLINTIDDYRIENIYFSPDSRTIASIDYYKIIKLWSIEGQQLLKFNKHNNSIVNLMFSVDSQTITSVSNDGRIKIWRRDGQVIANFKMGKNKISRAIFSPDGKRIISIGNDRTLRLWTINGKEIKVLHEASYSLELDQSIEDKISFSADGNLIVFATTYQEDSNLKYIVKIWNKDGILVKSVKGVNRTVSIDQISFSPDGKSFTIPNKDYILKKWDISGKTLATLVGHTSNVNSASFSADGAIVASASDDKTVKVWNSNGNVLYNLPHKDKVNSVQFSSDGKMIVSASNDKTVKIWSSDGKLVYTLSHDEKVNTVRFSSDNKMIASASNDKTVKIWSNNGELLHTLSHDDKVKDIKFSPDNKIIATINDSKTVKLWSTLDGKEKILLGKSGNISGELSFSPDSKTLATLEGNILSLYFLDSLWSYNATVNLNSSSNSEVIFSADGQKIVFGTSKSANVLVLSLNIDELLTQGCSRVRDYLQNNPNVKESDRHLCDDVPKELPPAKEK